MGNSSFTALAGTVVTKVPLNIRSGAPSVSAPVAMKVPAGSELTVRGSTTGDPVGSDSRWYAGLSDSYFWAGGCGPLKSGAAANPVSGNLSLGRVESAPPGSLGFDINRPLTGGDAAGFRAKGFRFCVRYLTRDAPAAHRNDLSRAETGLILDAGLALMAVQHVAPAGWLPTGTLGGTYGANAVANAQSAGLPPGVNIWLDLESVRGDTPRQDVIDYCNAWFAQVEAAGYATGVYVGIDIVISADDLYWNLKTRHYWKSGSKVPDIPHRGYQMIQRIPLNDKTDSIDTDVTCTDALGDSVQWLVRP